MKGLAALLLGALFLRPRGGVGADHRGQPGRRHRTMHRYQGSSHTHATIDPNDSHFEVGPDGTVHRIPVQPQAPTYDPTMMDPGYAQQYYGGAAYPGQDYYGGMPVAYGGYAQYGATYGGGYGSPDGDGWGGQASDLEQTMSDWDAWMNQ